jgi:signal transduction histidine kinase
MSIVCNVANHLPAVALNFGLVSALEWLVGDFGKRTGIACRLVQEADERELSDARATALFPIVQESVTKVARLPHYGGQRRAFALSAMTISALDGA